MPDALAGQVLDSARSHLNDLGATIWGDPVLIPFLQEAHRELRTVVVLNGIPVINEVTAVLNVPAQTTDLSTVTGYPTDMIVPIWLKERQVGQDNSDFIDMTPRDFVPNINMDIWLFWWCWRDEKIFLVGSLNAEQVQLRYRRQLTTPVVRADSIGWLNAENFLSYRTAALACQSIGEQEKHDNLMKTASVNLDTVVRLNVKQMQGLQARRRPYHRRYSNNTIIRGI